MTVKPINVFDMVPGRQISGGADMDPFATLIDTPERRQHRQTVVDSATNVLRDDALDEEEKRQRVIPLIPMLDEVCKELREDVRLHHEQSRIWRRTTTVVNELRERWGGAWGDSDDAPIQTSKFTVEPNEVSRLHHLLDQIDAGELHSDLVDKDGEVRIGPSLTLDKAQKEAMVPFVIGHDWAAAMGDVPGDGDIHLPYDLCAFEYRISGVSLIAMMRETDANQSAAVFVSSKAGEWLFVGNADGWLWRQIRAACIMLDAEVVDSRVIRAPHKLNAKREKAGKQPLRDFHIIDLSKRHRVPPPATSCPTGQHRRFHYVRGHWRHYEQHKTWIKWHVRGDAALGIVTKEYRA